MFELSPYRVPTADEAIELLRKTEPENGFFGCFSGGKDSVTIKALASMAGVRVEWHYHKAPDPPELVKFIRKEHPDVIFDRPKHGNFFNRMVHKGFPTRKARWCCDEYKEVSLPKGAVVLMGIRSEESPRRASHWGIVCKHFRSGNMVVNPIFEWATDEVWNFIRENDIPYCSLYDEGFKRLGCIGCPTARLARQREFERWPKFEAKWKKAFRLIWARRTGTLQRDGRTWFGDVYFDNWKEMWDWWLYDRPLPEPKQLKLFEKE